LEKKSYTPEFSSIIAALEHHVKTTPDQIVFRLLEDGESEAETLTFKELYKSAKSTAAELLKHAKKGDRALLVFPTGMGFIKAFYGCVLSGIVAVPMYPPSGRRRIGRLENVANDCGPTLVISTSQIKNQSKEWFDDVASFHDVTWIELDQILPEDSVSLPKLTDDDLVFLQYTSGSTGDPKGVQVTHSNILYNVDLITAVSGKCVQLISWLPIYHDMGLIGNIINTVYNGGVLTFMAPVDFIRKPVRWLNAVKKYKAEILTAPNFAFDLCVKQLTDEEIDNLDLSTLNRVYNGAEPIKASTIRAFSKRFAKAGFKVDSFLPCYGLAETTLMTTGVVSSLKYLKLDKNSFSRGKVDVVDDTLEDRESIELVSSGPFLPTFVHAIVNPDTQVECAPDEIGELWLAGPSITKGYWNRKEINNEIYGATIKDRNGIPLADRGIFLRTGDMGFVSDEFLFITGRIKEMIIINGANYYPYDIEATIQDAHPALQQNAGAVFSIEDEQGQPQIVVLQEITRAHLQKYDAREIFASINRVVVQEHQLSPTAIGLISPGRIPKTTSGKIQRSLCQKMYNKGEIDGLLDFWSYKDSFSPEKKPQEKLQSLSTSSQSQEELVKLHELMKNELASTFKIDISRVDIHKSFAELGLSSIQGIQLAERLSFHLGKEVPVTDLYDYFTIHDLSRHILGIQSSEETLVADKTLSNEPIAIIGMSCRFPGAKDTTEFWNNLVNKTDSIDVIPPERWNFSDYYSEEQAPFKMISKWGGFLKDIDLFDEQFFSISPREAEVMDPQQRIMLEQVYHLMENAGYPSEKMRGKDVGVFVGISGMPYSELVQNSGIDQNIYSATGNSLSLAANRVSYFYDFQGPSVAVDTACSSSLVALHQAVKSLRNGEASMAIAGGVNIILTPDVNVFFSQSGLLSAGGRCKSFDASADGITRSEGCGVVLLKPLSKAIEDGDQITAIIRGSAVNQDGRSNGITAPNGLAQQKVIKAALADAGIRPEQVKYVETHGTGTILGDPIEAHAIDAVYRNGKGEPILLGALKANIGHMEAAAGIGGLIKAALALSHGSVPGHSNFKTPNPQINWDKVKLSVPTETTSLANGEEHFCAAISSFGFGGTNAHVILENYIAPPAKNNRMVAPRRSVDVIPISGREEKSLNQKIKDLHGMIESHSEISLSDLSYSLSLGKDHFSKRAVVIGNSREQILKGLKGLADNQETIFGIGPLPKLANSKKAFLFTGAGAQYAGMGKEYYQNEPIFAQAIDECFAITKNLLKDDLKKIMFSTSGSEEEKLLNRIDLMQPIIFTYEYAMFKWWESLGVNPDMVIGHSLGEIVAACVSGVFSLSDALRLTVLRGKLIGEMPIAGTMASVQASEEDVAAVIAGREGRVSIGVINGKNQTVVSGHVEDVQAVVDHFDKKGAKTKVLKIARAGHSPLMDAISGAFSDLLDTFVLQPSRIPLVSNTTGAVAGKEISTSQYWVDHLRQTVRFSDGLNTLFQAGCDVLIEVGPHPVLSGIASQDVFRGANYLSLPSASEDPKLRDLLYLSVVRYYVSGGEINWKAYHANRGLSTIPTPMYPFTKKKFWVKPNEAGLASRRVKSSPAASAIADGQLRTDWIYDVTWQPAPLEKNPVAPKNWLILCSDMNSEDYFDFLMDVKTKGIPHTVVSNWDQAHSMLRDSQFDALAVIWGKRDEDEEFNIGEINVMAIEGLRQLQDIMSISNSKDSAFLKRIYWITEGFESENKNLLASPLWALGRTFMEETIFDFKLVDINRTKFDQEKMLHILLSLGDENQIRLENIPEVLRLNKHQISTDKKKITGKSTYIITGGISGLGLQTALYLAKNTEIEHLMLWSRRQPSEEVNQIINFITESGKKVTVIQVDVTDETAVEAALSTIPEEYPLKGILHIAGLSDKALIPDLTIEQLERIMAPKVLGSWNLHKATLEMELETFLMFSSQSSLGLPGTGNYAVANIFLDSLAAYRRDRNLPAQTIIWGAWDAITDMVDANNIERLRAYIKQRGEGMIDLNSGMDILNYALHNENVPFHIYVAPLNLKNTEVFKTAKGNVQNLYRNLFTNEENNEEISNVKSSVQLADLWSTLSAANETERFELLSVAIREQVAFVIRQEDSSTIKIDVDLFDFGIDSLMASEIVNRLSRMLRHNLSPTIIFDQRTINELTIFLLDVRLDFTGQEASENNSDQEEVSSVMTQEALRPTKANGSSTNPSESLNWDELLKTTIIQELIAQGKRPETLNESRSLGRQLTRLASLLNKKV